MTDDRRLFGHGDFDRRRGIDCRQSISAARLRVDFDSAFAARLAVSKSAFERTGVSIALG